jgi:hypothetical protein
MGSSSGDARGAFLTEQFWRLISLSPYFTALALFQFLIYTKKGLNPNVQS